MCFALSVASGPSTAFPGLSLLLRHPNEYKIIISKVVCEQRLSLTWPAVMQSYKDARKCLHHKKFQLLQCTD